MAVLSAVTCAGGCAEPIKTEYYSRTPPTEPQWKPSGPASSMRVGIGAESMEDGGTFAAYASGLGTFEYIGWARPELVPDLDCQVECAVSFEHDGGKQPLISTSHSLNSMRRCTRRSQRNPSSHTMARTYTRLCASAFSTN